VFLVKRFFIALFYFATGRDPVKHLTNFNIKYFVEAYTRVYKSYFFTASFYFAVEKYDIIYLHHNLAFDKL